MTAPVRTVDLEAMRAALAAAEEAGRAGEIPVGAALRLDDGRVVVAANRMRRGADATAHAELVVLQEGARRWGVDVLRGGTLVVTLEPCAMCAGAIVLARVSRLVFGAYDDKAGMCGSVGDLVRHPRLNHRPEVQGGVLAEESAALLRAFFTARRAAPRAASE